MAAVFAVHFGRIIEEKAKVRLFGELLGILVPSRQGCRIRIGRVCRLRGDVLVARYIISGVASVDDARAGSAVPVSGVRNKPVHRGLVAMADSGGGQLIVAGKDLFRIGGDGKAGGRGLNELIDRGQTVPRRFGGRVHPGAVDQFKLQLGELGKRGHRLSPNNPVSRSGRALKSPRSPAPGHSRCW